MTSYDHVPRGNCRALIISWAPFVSQSGVQNLVESLNPGGWSLLQQQINNQGFRMKLSMFVYSLYAVFFILLLMTGQLFAH